MNHDEIQWEYCPIPSNHLHGRYRGFDLHQWVNNMLCFYSSEGEATFKELTELLERINTPGIAWDGSIYNGIRSFVAGHNWQVNGKTCLFKERHDNQLQNFCLEARAPTLDERLTLLDEIIDALWEQSGLNSKPVELPVGRWR